MLNNDTCYRKWIGTVFKSCTELVKYLLYSCGFTLILISISAKEDYLPQIPLQVVYKLINAIFFFFLIGNGILYTAHSVTKEEIVIAEKAALSKEPLAIENHNRRISSVHEAGHVVIAYLLNYRQYDVHVSWKDSYCVIEPILEGPREIKRRILLLYGGAAAEKLLLGEIHNGCMGNPQADYERATENIKSYITMIDDSVSKAMLTEEVREKIISYSKLFYSEAENMVYSNRDMVELLREELSKKDIMTTKEVDELFEKHGMKGRRSTGEF